MPTVQSPDLNDSPGSRSRSGQKNPFREALQWHYPSDAHYPIAGIQFPESRMLANPYGFAF